MHYNITTRHKNKILFVLFFSLCGYMIYAPMTSNYLINPDGICMGLVYKRGSEGEELGRIGISVVDALFGKVVSPNLMLVISLCILALTVYLIIELFHVESFIDMVCLSALALLVPTTSSTFTYYYCMISYILAYFLSVFVCYFPVKMQKNWAFVIGSMFMAMQLSLYQAYLSVSIVIVLLYLCYLLVMDVERSKILGMAFKFGGMGIFGVGLYLVLLKVMRIQLSNNRGFDKMGHIDVASLPSLIRKAYRAFANYFLGDNFLNNSWLHRDLINVFTIAFLIGIFICLWLRKKMYRETWKNILGGGIILLLPIATEIMVIAAPGVDTYGSTGILLIPGMVLMYMSVVLFHPLIVRCFQCKNDARHKIIRYAYLVVIFPLLWNLLCFTAAFENVMWLNYHSTYSLCERMGSQIDKHMNKYEEIPKIMIGGNPEEGNYPCAYEELRAVVNVNSLCNGLSD